MPCPRAWKAKDWPRPCRARSITISAIVSIASTGKPIRRRWNAPNSLPLFASEVIFFAAQEAIRNAAKHGRGGDAQRPLHLDVALQNRIGLAADHRR